jgi:hypothetical protein
MGGCLRLQGARCQPRWEPLACQLLLRARGPPPPAARTWVKYKKMRTEKSKKYERPRRMVSPS